MATGVIALKKESPLQRLREIKRHLANREFGNGITTTNIIGAVGKQCQRDSIQSK